MRDGAMLGVIAAKTKKMKMFVSVYFFQSLRRDVLSERSIKAFCGSLMRARAEKRGQCCPALRGMSGSETARGPTHQQESGWDARP